MTNTHIHRSFFRTALRAQIAADAAYEADVRDWYENGDGRSPDWQTDINEEGEVYQWNAGGRGYSYPYCPHGMSRWTDYDNICGGCEDSLSAIKRAQALARSALCEYERRFEVFRVASIARVPQDVRDSLLAWVFEAVPS